MFKVCIFGDGGVGKTTLVNRYLTGVFKTDISMTIGVDFHIKKIDIDGIKVTLQIWDFAGEERFRFLLPAYVRGSSAGIFMYDITRYSSINNFNDWINVFKNGVEEGEEVPLVMVGGKLDLEHKRAIPRKEGIKLAREKDFYGFVECSAKTGQNAEVTFITIARIIMEKSGMI